MAKKASTSVNGESPEHIKAYESHGVSFHEKKGTDWKASCPFCGGSSMFVNVKEGLFHCKTCPAAGNKYTFLQLYYDHWFKRTTEKQYKELEKDRGIPFEAFEMAEYAYDRVCKRWLIPVRKEGSMVNLGRWSLKPLADGKRPVMMTGGCKVHLGNTERIGDAHKVCVVEGPWDCAALEWLLLTNKVKDTSVVWVPGSNTFKEEWSPHFVGKEVQFFYDNDDPGYQGMDRAIDIVRQNSHVKSLAKISWPSSFPEKYDLRDYISKNQLRPKRGLAELLAMLEEVKGASHKRVDLVRESFASIVEDFERQIHLSADMREALVIICAVILSNKIFTNPFCPLWMFIVAPSGAGKTLLLQTTAELSQVSFQTTLTPKTLVSGYRTPDGSDPSLLPLIIGKSLVIEDFTGIMSLGSQEQDEIYGVLRSCYNGRYEKPFGHLGVRVYPDPTSGHETCHFTILAGCTGAIHADRRANHGERFLKFHMSTEDYDPIPQIRAAIRNTVDEVAPELELRKSVTAFIQHKDAEKIVLPTVPDHIEDKVIGVGQIVATVRAVILRKSGELLVRPESEIASRISQQLIKFGQAVAYTLDKPEVDEECYKLMERVGMDTCYGWHRDALMTVAAAGEAGANRNEVCQRALMASTTAQRCLEDLMELGAIRFVVEETKKNGRPTYRWFLTDLTSTLFKMSGIDAKKYSMQKQKVTLQKKSIAKLAARKIDRSKLNGHLPTNGEASSLPRKKVASRLTKKGVKKKRIASK